MKIKIQADNPGAGLQSSCRPISQVQADNPCTGWQSRWRLAISVHAVLQSYWSHPKQDADWQTRCKNPVRAGIPGVGLQSRCRLAIQVQANNPGAVWKSGYRLTLLCCRDRVDRCMHACMNLSGIDQRLLSQVCVLWWNLIWRCGGDSNLVSQLSIQTYGTPSDSTETCAMSWSGLRHKTIDDTCS